MFGKTKEPAERSVKELSAEWVLAKIENLEKELANVRKDFSQQSQILADLGVAFIEWTTKRSATIEAIRPLQDAIASLILTDVRHDKDMDSMAELRGQVPGLVELWKQANATIGKLESQVTRHQNELQKLLLIPTLVDIPAIPEKVTVTVEPAVAARYEIKSKR